ncbi:hypothetical protein HYV31_03055 [candidate division WWE3 bacterium]|nr:hypothetical protein [candidate division WWE3 bacterium]
MKLSQESLAELKNKLQTKKLALSEELKLLNGEDTYHDLSRADGNSEDADEAYEDLAHEETQIKLHDLQKSLFQVDKALNLMETGSYGLCEICSGVIDQARLEVYPEATTCFEHAI